MTTAITPLAAGEEEKILAFGEILQKLERANETSIVPILKKIEANTSVLKTCERTKTEVSKFPRTTLAGRGNSRSRFSTPAMPTVTAKRAGATPTRPSVPMATVDAPIPARMRDRKGRFVGKTPAQDIIPDESGKIGKEPLSQILKRILNTAVAGRSRGLLPADTMKEAVGRAIGGPLFDAAMEIKDVVDSVKVPPDAKKMGNDKIIKTLMKSNMSDEKRHKELIKAIMSGNRGGGGTDINIPFFPGGNGGPKTPSGGGMLSKIGSVLPFLGKIGLLAAATIGTVELLQYMGKPEVRRESEKRQKQADALDAQKGKPSDAWKGAKAPVGEGVAQFVGREEGSGRYDTVNLHDTGETVAAGMYQFNSKGELPNFLRTRDKSGKTNAEKFGITVDPERNRNLFKRQWEAAALGTQKAEFAKAQDAHFESSVVKPALARAEALAVNVADTGTQKILASMATTTGSSGNKAILKNAVEAGGGYKAFKGLSAKKQQELIVTERKRYVQGLSSMTLKEKAAAMKRYDRELAEVTDAPSTPPVRSADGASIVTASAPIQATPIIQDALPVAIAQKTETPSDAEAYVPPASVETISPAPWAQAATSKAASIAKATVAEAAGHMGLDMPTKGAGVGDIARGWGEKAVKGADFGAIASTVAGDAIRNGKMNFSNVRDIALRTPLATLATGMPARAVSLPERITTSIRTGAATQAQGMAQGIGSDINGMLLSAFDKLTESISKITKSEEVEKPGVPAIKTEFDDTMLTLMAYDRI